MSCFCDVRPTMVGSESTEKIQTSLSRLAKALIPQNVDRNVNEFHKTAESNTF